MNVEEYLKLAVPARKSKMRNKKTVLDGVTFSSKKEAKDYEKLKDRMAHGKIRNLKLQPKFTLIVNGAPLRYTETRRGYKGQEVIYKADFEYEELVGWDKWERVVQDTKGQKSGVPYQLYRLKISLMWACHKILVRET